MSSLQYSSFMSSDPFVEEEIGSTVCPAKEHLWNLLKKWSQVVVREAVGEVGTVPSDVI